MGIEVDDSSESIQEFQLILDELVGDESMEKVRGEYEKLIQVLLKSRENEKRLMSKCRELNAKIVSTTTKVADALKMRQEDETKMNFLKRVRLYICWRKSLYYGCGLAGLWKVSFCCAIDFMWLLGFSVGAWQSLENGWCHPWRHQEGQRNNQDPKRRNCRPKQKTWPTARCPYGPRPDVSLQLGPPPK